MRQAAILLTVLCWIAGPALGKTSAPAAVSPGSPSGVALVEARCPTFSWGAVKGARSFELVAYRIDEEGEETQPALRQSLPGSVSSWTPSLERCLVRGESYAWSIRSQGRRGRRSSWSEPALFQVAGEPTPAEHRQDRAVVERGAGDSGEAPGPARSPRPPAPVADPDERPASGALGGARRAPQILGPATAKVAVVGKMPDTHAETYGVLGITRSDENESAGVVGLATATTGEVMGVRGINYSPAGTAVQGNNEATTAGAGVVGYAAADSGLSIGTAGIAASSGGYGGLFWNFASGDALAVADPAGYPTSVDVKFSVDTSGNVDGTSFTGDGSGLTNVTGKVVNVTVYTNATRQAISGAASHVMASFSVDKRSATSLLLVQGSIAGFDENSGALQQGWKYGMGTEVPAQMNFYPANSDFTLVYPTMAVIEGHTTTGVQTLQFRFFAQNGSTTEKPFEVYNPNSSDDVRLAQTRSVYVAWEIEP